MPTSGRLREKSANIQVPGSDSFKVQQNVLEPRENYPFKVHQKL